MKEKSKTSVSIIGGADGPTSIYIAGKTGKKPLKVKIWNYIYKFKRNKAEKQVVAGAHTLEEVVAYARDKYGAIDIDTSQMTVSLSFRNIHGLRCSATERFRRSC